MLERGRWGSVALTLLRLAFTNLDLVYWALPRRWRGGYRSPWLARVQLR